MSISKHGLSVGMERVDNLVYLNMKIVGKLTHEDYLTITPMLEKMLLSVTDPKVKVFVDASKLEGWELEAAWDDLKLGLKYGNDFEKIAIKGKSKWQKYLSLIASWFMQGEIEYFEDKKSAIAWLEE